VFPTKVFPNLDHYRVFVFVILFHTGSILLLFRRLGIGSTSPKGVNLKLRVLLLLRYYVFGIPQAQGPTGGQDIVVMFVTFLNEFFQGIQDTPTRRSHATCIVLQGPRDDNATDFVVLNDLGESIGAGFVNRHVTVIIQTQGFQFMTLCPKGRMRRHGNSNAITMDIQAQDGGTIHFFPIQGRGYLRWFT
jgi:hypothetical protein